MTAATHYRVIEDVRDAVRGRELYYRLDPGATDPPRAGVRITTGFEFVDDKAALDPKLTCNIPTTLTGPTPRRGRAYQTQPCRIDFGVLVEAELRGHKRKCVECGRWNYHVESCSRGRR